ncbi:MAG: hypothetical protein Fur0024_2640 [Patescibacteria group bacterium]
MKIFTKTLSEDAFGLSSVFKIKDIWGDLPDFLGSALIVAGVLSVVFLIIAGFQYLTSNGQDDKAKVAKKNIQFSITGLIIILLSYAIINGVLTLLGENTLGKEKSTNTTTTTKTTPLSVNVSNCPPQTNNIRFSVIGGTGTKTTECYFQSSKGNLPWASCTGGIFDTKNLIADDGTNVFYIRAADLNSIDSDSCEW